jgi:hypothetical protein
MKYVDNDNIYRITLIEGSGDFLPFSGGKRGLSHEPKRGRLCLISLRMAEKQLFYIFKRPLKNKRNIEPVPKTYQNELDKLIKISGLQNLILTKSLIEIAD